MQMNGIKVEGAQSEANPKKMNIAQKMVGGRITTTAEPYHSKS
jgi:hypothetical protein